MLSGSVCWGRPTCRHGYPGSIVFAWLIPSPLAALGKWWTLLGDHTLHCMNVARDWYWIFLSFNFQNSNFFFKPYFKKSGYFPVIRTSATFPDVHVFQFLIPWGRAFSVLGRVHPVSHVEIIVGVKQFLVQASNKWDAGCIQISWAGHQML